MIREPHALDYDDTLVASAPGWVAFSHTEWGHNPNVLDYREEWSDWWGVSHEETKRRNDIIWERGIAADFSVLDGAQEGVALLAEEGPLVVVTSRPIIARAITEAQIEQNFSGNIQDVIFSGAYDLGTSARAYAATKLAILKKIRARRFTDDQVKHANPAAAAGIDVEVFGEYPWNMNVPLHPNARRVPNWKAIIKHEKERRAA